MKIKAYNPIYKDDVLAIFKLNTPHYFAEEEEDDFKNYLNKELEDYFIIEKEGKIVGCGGLNYGSTDRTVAGLSWGMIHPDFHGQGLGTILAQHRITFVQEHHSEVAIIRVRTSQHTYRFYEKMGFTLEEVTRGYWAKDLDLYDMKMDILSDSKSISNS